MSERPVEMQQTQGRALTILNLLLAMIFFVPAEIVFVALRHAHCGVLPYFLGVPVGLVLGAAMVWLTWQSAKFLWLEFSGRSKRTDNFLAIGALVLHIGSLILGFTSGALVGSILTRLFS